MFLFLVLVVLLEGYLVCRFDIYIYILNLLFF